MKDHTHKKSSFTLPSSEIPLITTLKKKLKLASNTDVIRKALRELKAKIDRDQLRLKFREASLMLRDETREEIGELDHLSAEGLGEN